MNKAKHLNVIGKGRWIVVFPMNQLKEGRVSKIRSITEKSASNSRLSHV